MVIKYKSRITYKDDAMSPTDNSIYAKGGDFDLKKRLGSFSEGPKAFGVPVKERLLSGVQGGIPAMVGGATNVEDVLPSVGQTFGGMAGDVVNPVVGGLGATAGAVTGQAARQGVKTARGFKPSFGQVEGEVLRTGIPETIGRVAFGALAPVANRLMIHTTNPASDVIKRNPRFGLDVLDQGIWGSPKAMVEKAGENIGKFEGEVRGAVRNTPGSISPRPIIKRFGELRNQSRSGLKAEDISGINDVESQFRQQYGTGGGMPLERGLDMKKAIYAETPDAAFARTMNELPGKTESRRAVAQEINKQIRSKAPSTAGALDKEAVAVQARKGLQAKMARGQKTVPFGKIPGMGAGAAFGGGNPAAGAGILLGNAVTGALRSGASLSFVAGQLYNLSKQTGVAAATRIAASEMLRQITQEER
jgi:hypothetical protein